MTDVSWLLVAAALTGGILVCGIAAWLRPAFQSVLAAQLGGTLATVALVCLTMGFRRSTYADVPVMAAVLNFVGSLVYVRFIDRSRL